MKSLLGLLGAVVCLIFLNGCVAVPPLVNVHHQDTGSKSRIEDLERRVRALEENAAQR